MSTSKEGGISVPDIQIFILTDDDDADGDGNGEREEALKLK